MNFLPANRAVSLQNAPYANAKGAKRTWNPSPKPPAPYVSPRFLGTGMQGQRSGQDRHHFIFPFGRWPRQSCCSSEALIKFKYFITEKLPGGSNCATTRATAAGAAGHKKGANVWVGGWVCVRLSADSRKILMWVYFSLFAQRCNFFLFCAPHARPCHRHTSYSIVLNNCHTVFWPTVFDTFLKGHTRPQVLRPQTHIHTHANTHKLKSRPHATFEVRFPFFFPATEKWAKHSTNRGGKLRGPLDTHTHTQTDQQQAAEQQQQL